MVQKPMTFSNFTIEVVSAVLSAWATFV